MCEDGGCGWCGGVVENPRPVDVAYGAESVGGSETVEGKPTAEFKVVVLVAAMLVDAWWW